MRKPSNLFKHDMGTSAVNENTMGLCFTVVLWGGNKYTGGNCSANVKANPVQINPRFCLVHTTMYFGLCDHVGQSKGKAVFDRAGCHCARAGLSGHFPEAMSSRNIHPSNHSAHYLHIIA